MFISNLKSQKKKLDEIFADKMCDQVSDAILDAHLKQDPDAKVSYHRPNNLDFPNVCITGCLRDSDKDWNDHGVRRDHQQGSC